MSDDEKFDIEPVWLEALRRLWIANMDRGQTPDDVALVDAELRELLEDYPPIKNGTVWNMAPLVYGLARKIGRDPDELLAEFTRGQQRDRDERADAVEAAEDLLRGD